MVCGGNSCIKNALHRYSFLYSIAFSVNRCKYLQYKLFSSKIFTPQYMLYKTMVCSANRCEKWKTAHYSF